MSDRNAFRMALTDGDISRVGELLGKKHITATTPLPTYGISTKVPLEFVVKGHDGEDKTRAKIAEMLLLHGADPNVGTPLVTASFYGYVEVMRVLLEFGANKDAVNEQGITASDALNWTSKQFAKKNASAINELLDCPPKLRETTPMAVASPEEPLHHDIETMGGGASAASVVVLPDEATIRHETCSSSDDESYDE